MTIDIDAVQAADNERYENNRRAIKVINQENTPPLDVHKVPEEKGYKEQNQVFTPHPDVHKVPKGKNVKELIKSKKPKDWIIDQIASNGSLVLLAGESGSGKTSLCYSMANAIAKGDLFLNTFQTKKQKVAFIQADESETNCADKLETMGIDSDITFYFSDTFEKLTVNELPKFQDWVDKHDYDVVFLDSITTLLTGGKHSFKDAEFAAPLYFLNTYASKKGILIVFTTHLKKPEHGVRKRVTKHDVMGNQSIFSGVSDCWSIHKSVEPDFDDHYLFDCIKGRNCQEGTFYNLQGNQESYEWFIESAGLGQLTPDEENSCTNKVLFLFYKQDEYLSIKDIANKVAYSEKQVIRVVRNLFKQGKLKRIKKQITSGRPTYFYGHST
jgi:archaellum biogenesis ATPase FlaH